MQSLPLAVYTPLAEDIGLDRLAPDSGLTRELAEPLRELAGNHCPTCGQANRPGAFFCAYCGAMLKPETPAAFEIPARIEGPGRLANGVLLRERYRVLRKVAQGGMGAVYEVSDEAQGGKRLAIKEMAQTALSTEERTQALKDFLREATILATLDHPNLPAFDGVFGENGNYYLVMEFVQGRTMESVLSNTRDFVPEHKVIAWAAQLCSVLEYLHAQDPPIIYRDCKPGNIMVVDGVNQIKLIDFGIARFHRTGKVADSIAFGTAGYAPPEQYGNGQTDQRSDIYALGATLHHLLSGHDPGDNPFHWKPVRYYNPRVSRKVDQAIMRAVNLKPEERFSSIGEFALAIGLQARTEPLAPAMVAAAAPPKPVVPEAKPVAVAPPEIVSRPVIRSEPKVEEPKPAPVADPSKPLIAVSDNEIEIGATKKARKTGRRVNVINVGGGELKGIVHTTAPWLAVSAAQFAGNTADVVVTSRGRGLKTGHLDLKVPNVLAWWGKHIKHLPLQIIVILWMVLFVTQGYRVGIEGFTSALLAGVVAGMVLLWMVQIAIWLVARHVRLFVPAPKQNVGQVVFDSNGGTKQVTVRVTARPAMLRLLIGWILTALVLMAEIGIVLWLLNEMAII